MKLNLTSEPRKFCPKKGSDIEISDYGSILLAPDEMVTFVSQDGAELDFAAKNWGYYPIPSVNGRLKENGYKTAVVRNSVTKRVYVLVVESGSMEIFLEYCEAENCEVEFWLDEI